MKDKFLILILITFLLTSCAGMGTKRSDKSDEFLVEKKNPLVMPPDIKDLPLPKEKIENEENENDFKEILKSNSDSSQTPSDQSSNSIEESIIKKIEE